MCNYIIVLEKILCLNDLRVTNSIVESNSKTKDIDCPGSDLVVSYGRKHKTISEIET